MNADDTDFDKAVKTVRTGLIVWLTGATCSLLGACTSLLVTDETIALLVYLASAAFYTLCAVIILTVYTGGNR